MSVAGVRLVEFGTYSLLLTLEVVVVNVNVNGVRTVRLYVDVTKRYCTIAALAASRLQSPVEAGTDDVQDSRHPSVP